MDTARAIVARLNGIFCLPSVLFSLALSVALVIGRSFFLTNGLFFIFGSFGAIARAAGRALLYFLILSVLSALLMRWLNSDRGRLRDSISAPTKQILGLFMGETWRTPVVLGATIFTCWVPCMLAYWPGMYSYDIGGILPQGTYGPYNSIQPLLYTLFVKAIYWIARGGGTAGGMLGVAITQMAILSAIYAVVIWRLNRLRVHLLLRWLGLIWFALYPSIAIFTIAETKDGLFAGVFALTTVFLLELARDPALFFKTALRPVSLSGLMVLLCLLRNNGAWMLLLLIVAVIAQHRTWKEVFKQMLMAIGSAFVVGFSVTQILLPAIGVRGFSRVMFSVPIQQIAYTHKVDAPNLDKSDRNVIYNWIQAEIDNDYNPRYADPMMLYSRDVDLSPRTFEFLKTWLHVGLTHPAEYTEAFLTLTLQTWYPGSAFPDQYAQKPYIETENYPESGVVRQSKAPILLDLYQSVAIEATWQHIPVVSLLFDTATPLWFMLFGIALLVKRKQRREMIVFLLPLALLATILLGPSFNGRYMLPFFVSFPIWLVALLSKTVSTDERDGSSTE